MNSFPAKLLIIDFSNGLQTFQNIASQIFDSGNYIVSLINDRDIVEDEFRNPENKYHVVVVSVVFGEKHTLNDPALILKYSHLLNNIAKVIFLFSEAPDTDPNNISIEISRYLRAGAFACLSVLSSFNEIRACIDLAASQSHQLSLLAEFSTAVQSFNTVKELTDLTFSYLRKLVGWDKVTLVLIGKHYSVNDELSMKHVRSVLAFGGYNIREMNRDLLIPIEDDELVQIIVSEGRPCVFPDLKNNKPDIWKTKPQTEDVLSWIGLPLIYGVRTIGLITLDHKIQGHYADVDVEILKRFSDIVAAEIEAKLTLRNLQVVRRIMQKISDLHRIEDLLEVTLSDIRAELNSTRCTYFRRLEKIQEDRNITSLELWADEHGVTSQADQFSLEEGQGVSGWVLKFGRSLNIHDTRLEKNVFVTRGVDWKDPIALLAVPVKIQDRVIGVICADKDRKNYFSAYDLDLLELISQQIAAVIERTLTLGLLSEISVEVNRSTTKEEVLKSILLNAMKLTNSTSGVIWRVVKENDSLSVVMEYGAPKIFVHPKPRLLGDSLSGKIIEDRKLVQISPQSQNLELMNPALRLLGVNSIIGAPLLLDNELLGIISLNSSTKDKFNAIEEFSLQLFANQAAIAIRKIEALEKASHQAEIWKKLGDAASAVMRNNVIDNTFSVIAEQALALVNGDYSHLARVYSRDKTRIVEFVSAYPRGHLDSLKEKVGSIDLETGSEFFKNRIGITGLAVKEVKPIWVQDISTDMQQNDSLVGRNYINYQADTVAELAVPILDDNDKAIGVINVEYSKQGVLQEEHRSILELFAGQAAIALQKDLLLTDKIRREQQLSKLADITQAILSAQPDNLESTLRQVVENIRQALKAKDVIVVRMQQVDPFDFSSQILVESLFSCEPYTPELAVRDGEVSLSRWVYKTRHYHIIEDVQFDDQVNPAMKQAGVRAAICLPLKSRVGMFGVMWLHFDAPRRVEYFLPELDIFQVYADQIALTYEIIEQAQVDKKELRKLREDMTRDINIDFDVARKQSRFNYIFGWVGITIGYFLIIFYLANPLGLSLPLSNFSLFASSILEIVSFLFIARADSANKRADRYHRELLEVRQHNILMESTLNLANRDVRSKAQQDIISQVTNNWFDKK